MVLSESNIISLFCLFPLPLHTGYYYDLDDSYDESDEEEVRAHLRCVAEQPPLKLDTSSEVSTSFPPILIEKEFGSIIAHSRPQPPHRNYMI